MPLKMFQRTSQSVDKGISQKTCVIAVAAGKGGVGKSTVTVNLALCLKNLGYSVGVMDTDIYGPSLRKMLPEEKLPSKKENNIIPASCSGIPMISLAYFRKDDEASVIRAPIANGLINQFINQVEWGELDYLLVDFPPGTGDVQLTICQQARLTGAVIVTTPQEIALLDVRKAMNMFDQVQVPIVGIIENMSYFTHPQSGENLFLFGQGGGRKLADQVRVPFLGCIPIDPDLCQCSDEGKSIFSSHFKQSPSVQAFLTITQEMLRTIPLISSPISIKKMGNKDSYTLTIEWSDGQLNDYKISDIQKNCPCADCADEKKEKLIDPQVQINKIEAMGKYALRFQFSSGCSHGLFPFELLRGMIP